MLPVYTYSTGTAVRMLYVHYLHPLSFLIDEHIKVMHVFTRLSTHTDQMVADPLLKCTSFYPDCTNWG